MPSYTIIIVTHNSANVIEECLSALANQERDIQSRIIVIDNNSSDSTRKICETMFPSLKVIYNRKNIGFAAAVNQASEFVDTDYLILLNPDVITDKKFLGCVDGFLLENTEADIIGVQLMDSKWRPERSCWKKPSYISLIFETFLPYKLSVKLMTTSTRTVSEADAVTGACMIIRSNLFNNFNGFDERFFMYYEDIDFCLRAKDAGYKVFYNPLIRAVHHSADSSRQNKQLFFINIYFSKLKYLKKYYSKRYFKIACLFIVAGILFKSVVYMIAGLLLFNKELRRLSEYHIFVLKNILRSEK